MLFTPIRQINDSINKSSAYNSNSQPKLSNLRNKMSESHLFQVLDLSSNLKSARSNHKSRFYNQDDKKCASKYNEELARNTPLNCKAQGSASKLQIGRGGIEIGSLHQQPQEDTEAHGQSRNQAKMRNQSR